MNCPFAPEPPTVVYLNSKQSVGYYPENRGSDFTNYLPVPITVEPDSYEVALTEIFYTPQKQVLIYFKNEDDRDIKIHKIGTKEKEVTVTKEDEDINGWLLSANLELESGSFEVEILEEISDHGSHITINNKNENKVFIVPASLATALGFSTARFNKGEHKSASPVNTELFENVEAEIKLTLELEDETKIVSVQEPSEYTLTHLLEEIAKALAAGKTGVSLSVNTSGTRISSSDPSVSIEFSARVAKTLGLPNVIYTVQNVYSQPTYVSWEPAPSIMCISCDIIHPTTYGSKTTSWLRVLQQSPSYGQAQHITFNPPTFHAVTKQFFQTIHIQITDENNRQFDFGDHGVTLTLQFRAKQ